MRWVHGTQLFGLSRYGRHAHMPPLQMALVAPEQRVRLFVFHQAVVLWACGAHVARVASRITVLGHCVSSASLYLGGRAFHVLDCLCKFYLTWSPFFFARGIILFVEIWSNAKPVGLRRRDALRTRA